METGFLDPYKDQSYLFEFYDKNDNIFGPYEVDLRKIETRPSYLMDTNNNKILFTQKLKIKNESRIITIGNTSMEELEKHRARRNKGHDKDKKKYDSDFTNIRMDFAKIGLSVISKFNGVVRENFFIYLDKVTVVAIMTSEQREYQLAINYLNIDNNYYALSKYPVLMTT